MKTKKCRYKKMIQGVFKKWLESIYNVEDIIYLPVARNEIWVKILHKDGQSTIYELKRKWKKKYIYIYVPIEVYKEIRIKN